MFYLSSYYSVTLYVINTLFSESKDTLENLTTAWITNYLYNTLTYNDLLDRAKFWYKYLSKSNKWKYSYMDKTTYNLLT